MKKNYREIFEKENQSIFTQKKQMEKKAKNRRIKVGVCVALVVSFFLTYLPLGWDFLGFGLKSYSPNHIPIVIIIGSLLFLFAGFIIYEISSSLFTRSLRKEITIFQRTLKREARKFAVTTYLDDILAALSTTFTLDDIFKKKLLDILYKLDWFHDDSFTCNTGDFYWEEVYVSFGNKDNNIIRIQEKLTLIYEKKEYSLKKCYYEDGEFHFLFDTLDANGRFEENVKFRLPNK